MVAVAENRASSKNARPRSERGAKKAETERLKGRMTEIAEAERPQTGAAYNKVIRLKKELCYATPAMWDWFADGSRTYFRNSGFQGSDDPEFLREVRDLYGRDLWATLGGTIQVWCESRSIALALSVVAYDYGVDLYPSGGMSSDQFLYGAARSLMGRPDALVLYVGDYDPRGFDIDNNIQRKVKYFFGVHPGRAPQLEFQRLSVT